MRTTETQVMVDGGDNPAFKDIKPELYSEPDPGTEVYKDVGEAEDPPSDAEQNEAEAEETKEYEPEDVGTTEAENHLNKIQNQLLRIQEKAADVDSIKEDLRAAKTAHENANDMLLTLVAQSRVDSAPLFNQKPADPVGDEAATEDPDENAWKLQPISVLWAGPDIKGLGAAKQKALIDHCPTLNDFEILRVEAGNDNLHLSNMLPKGMGDKMADELEKRHLDFIVSFNDFIVSFNPAKMETGFYFNLTAYVAELTSEDGWDENLESDDEFDQGKRDFIDGHNLEDLRFDIIGDGQDEYKIGSDELRQWALGYASAKAEHEMENEQNQDQQGEPNPVAGL